MDVLQGFDLGSATLAGLAVIGVVNAVVIFQPNLDSRLRFIIAVVVALLVSFIPAELGNEILNRVKEAIVVAFASSGVYKIAVKAGGA